MTVEFVLGRHANGEWRRVRFDARIDDDEVLEFQFAMAGANIAAIRRQYDAVDRINRIIFTGISGVKLNALWVRLDITVLCGGGSSCDIVEWRARPPSHRVLRSLEPLTIPLKPIVVGTARVILADRKRELRHEIRAKAAHGARVMRANADAILAFLDLPIPIDTLEPISDTVDMISKRAQAATDVMIQTAGEFPHES